MSELIKMLFGGQTCLGKTIIAVDGCTLMSSGECD